MKNTYTGTLFIRNLKDAEVKLEVYENCKYNAKSLEDLGEIRKVICTGVIAWDLIEGGIEADEIESESDASSIDEFHEYLVLHFADGQTSTYRNSHVDMFIN